ncbi:type II secretion system protein GspD [Fuchsiella alkaliacetigena]|uniref:type II secretion system protein GspD n=1 Tax=Fuchsiella alkaliacetigena TaxID=957042 RepID=UPI00200B862F|nr:secretin N-terminal domain-containing protein [Fuchsiella alkaliacetigena]MCK8825290.1 hypothetical protein [Fuchsiella alkaliacetigena]
MRKIKIKIKRRIVVIILIIGFSALFTGGNLGVLAAENKVKEPIIDLDLRGVELRDAFSALADIADVNIVVDDVVEGQTTLRLRKLKFFKALDLLTKANALDYKVLDNSVIVSTPERLKELYSDQETAVFELNNSEPAELKESLSLIIDEGAIRVDGRTKSLIITAYEEDLIIAESLIKELDQAKRQVALEVRIEEFSHNKMEELGLGTEDLSLDNLTSLDYRAYIDALNFMENKGESSILARPQISTVDGEKANIMIGEEEPIFTYSIDEDGVTSSSVRYEEVGINLEITPQITENEKILVEVVPEITAIIDYRTDKETGNEYPVLSNRRVETNIRVASGETIVIGGLIKDEEQERRSQVSFLGDIPLIGRLFRRTRTEIDKTELVIFMTPTIIEEEEIIETAKQEEEVVDQEKQKDKEGHLELKAEYEN